MANIIAIVWDFDKTLVDGYMQDPIFEYYQVDSGGFWKEVNSLPKSTKKNKAYQSIRKPLNIFDGKEYEIWDMLELKKIKLKANYQKELNEKTIKNAPEKLYPVLQKYIAK